MMARFLLIPYSLAMAVTATLIHPCPCCGAIVKYTRLAAAACWILLAIGSVLRPARRFEACALAAVLSVVQVANHWNQFRDSRLNDVSMWVVPAAAAGALVFGAMAVIQRRKVPAR